MPRVHPGAVLEEILVDHGLTVVDAAARLGVSRHRCIGCWRGSSG
jgi:plasmid maintenance system antidote protein VapI